MISAEEYLANLKLKQVVASASTLPSASDPLSVELDSALTSALHRGWYLAPVLAQSKYFPQEAVAGSPTNDLGQICRWAKEYSQYGCNWAVETGARSGLVVLEFDYDMGRYAVQSLCRDDLSWRTTLQFTSSNARFVCFRYSGQRIRAVGREFPGVRLHCGSYLLIPPSVYADGSEISYLNRSARILEFPSWLLRTSPGTNQAFIPGIKKKEDSVYL
jgi:hypothetical protein